jgi:hypothetical protein
MKLIINDNEIKLKLSNSKKSKEVVISTQLKECVDHVCNYINSKGSDEFTENDIVELKNNKDIILVNWLVDISSNNKEIDLLDLPEINYECRDILGMDANSIIKKAGDIIVNAMRHYVNNKSLLLPIGSNNDGEEDGHGNASKVENNVTNLLTNETNMSFTHNDQTYKVYITKKVSKREFGDFYIEIVRLSDMGEFLYIVFPGNIKITYNDYKGQPNTASWNRMIQHLRYGSAHYGIFIIDCENYETTTNQERIYGLDMIHLFYLGNDFWTVDIGTGQIMIKKSNIHKYRLSNPDYYYMSNEFNYKDIFSEMIKVDEYQTTKHIEKCQIGHIKKKKMLLEGKKIHIDDKSKNK